MGNRVGDHEHDYLFKIVLIGRLWRGGSLTSCRGLRGTSSAWIPSLLSGLSSLREPSRWRGRQSKRRYGTQLVKRGAVLSPVLTTGEQLVPFLSMILQRGKPLTMSRDGSVN